MDDGILKLIFLFVVENDTFVINEIKYGYSPDRAGKKL